MYFEKKKQILSIQIEMLLKMQSQNTISKPKMNLDILMVENVIGDHTRHSQDCYYVCDASDIEDVKYGQFVKDVVNAQDLDYCCCQSDFSFEISTG